MAYSTLTIAFTSAIIYIITRAIYDIFFHPLAKVPGPLLAKVGCLWKFNAATSLKFADRLRAAHAKYGNVSMLCLSFLLLLFSHATPPWAQQASPRGAHTEVGAPQPDERSSSTSDSRRVSDALLQRPVDKLAH